MPKIRCRCGANPACRLCQGTGKFDYQPGEFGWQPFACPTCGGRRVLADAAALEGERPCFTCEGRGRVDPANPPSGGMWDDLYKILFGA